MKARTKVNPHLEFKDVHCCPPGRPALRGVNFSVSRGTFFAIEGANGSGKGTLCRCLARLIKEYQGSILLDGQNLPIKPQELPTMGLMVALQGVKVFPEMTVLENLLSAPRTWKIPGRRDRLDGVIRLLPHLKDRFRQMAGTLSGGEQQMVAIGRSLMAEPVALVLEEPSMGLAESTTHAVYAALAQISREGRTVIVTEETLTIAGNYASETCTMEQGKITTNSRHPAVSSSENPFFL